MIDILNRGTVYVVLRVVGLCLLASYLFLAWDFSFSWIGVIVYVVTSFSVSYVIAALRLAERYPKLDRYHFVSEKDLQPVGSRDDWAEKQAKYLESGFRRMRILLTPTEDALICVPLLVVGVSLPTALAAGVVFGLLHLGRFTYLECMGKAIIYGLVCYFVLPYGLLSVVAGHFINDALILLLLTVIRRSLEQRRREANLPSENRPG